MIVYEGEDPIPVRGISDCLLTMLFVSNYGNKQPYSGDKKGYSDRKILQLSQYLD